MFASMPLTLAAGSVLVLAVASALALLLRRSSAASRYVVWSAAMITLLALPIFWAALPAWHVLPVADNPMPPLAEVPAFSTEVVEFVPTFEMHVEAPIAEPAAPWPWAAMLVVMWALGVALLLSVPLLGWWRLKRLERQCKSVADEHWQRLLNDARRQIGIARPVTLLRCEERLMPMTWGITRPRILVPGVPGDADDWTDSRKKVVLLHELAHVKRLDVLTHLLAQLARALYWFNPLAWLALAQMRRERERACDDLVLSLGTRGPDYAGHLVEVAAPGPFGRASFAAVAMPMARSSRLEGRVRDILDERRPRKGMSRRGALAMLTLMLLIALPVACMKPEADANQPKVIADTSPPEEPKHFVRIVVGQDSVTFQGRKTTWDELPQLLEKVPNRAETVLEFAIASEETTVRELNEVTARAAAYARTYGFQYPSYVGVQPASSKRQRFVPQENTAKDTSWTVMDKPSAFNPKGWAVMARMALGGTVPVKLANESGERFRMQMVEGEDDAITLRLLRENVQLVTLTIERDRSQETELDGRRYRLRYSSAAVALDQPDTTPFAHVFLTPVDPSPAKVAGDTDEERGGWPAAHECGHNLKNVGQAIHTYRASQGRLPADLGSTLPYIDRWSQMTDADQRRATAAEKAAMYLCTERGRRVEPPAEPTPQWVNENTDFVYLGGPNVDLGKLPEGQWGTTVLVHEKLDKTHQTELGPLIVVAMVDGHTELLPEATAKGIIETSKRRLAAAHE